MSDGIVENEPTRQRATSAANPGLFSDMPAKLRGLVKSASIALGATSIYLLWLLAPLVTPNHDAVYHWSGSPSVLFVPPIIDFGAVWLILTVLFWLARSPGRVRVAIWSGAILFVPWISLRTWSTISTVAPSSRLSHALFLLALIALLLLLAFWRQSFEEKFEHYVEFVSPLLLVSALSGLLIVGRVVWFGWEARALNANLALHQRSDDRGIHAGRARVFWILFDELSYQQVYERRFRGLSLPAFDALASQSTVFTHTIPVGIKTRQILPSLMTGERADDVRSSADGRQLSMHNPDNKGWKVFDERDTVFEDALKLDYSTAVTGWYNPYCRILPEVLDHCFWTYDEAAQNTMVPHATLRSNIVSPLLHFFSGGLGYRVMSIVLRTPSLASLDAWLHISDFNDLSAATDRMLDDQSASFLFLTCRFLIRAGSITGERENLPWQIPTTSTI